MEEWDDLAAKNPNDMGVQTLHALWLGLCLKVERKDSTIQETNKIFEEVRGPLVRQRLQEKREELGPGFVIWLENLLANLYVPGE